MSIISLLNQTMCVAIVDSFNVIRGMRVTPAEETHHVGNELETLCTLSTT